MNDQHILLVECPDKRGLIYEISKIIYDQKLNIVSNHEYVYQGDSSSNRFFMRSQLEGQANQKQLAEKIELVLPQPFLLRVLTPAKKKIVIMATREYHCLGDLLLRQQFNKLNADIVAVVSNHHHLAELVKRFSLPYHCISHEGLTRGEHDREILAALQSYQPDYIILAKYMRILSKELIDAFDSKIINIHHSFLPAFVGAKPYHQAYHRGVKIIGATAHFANHELDQGPIIAQNVLPIAHSHSIEDLILAGHDIEKTVLAKALRLVLEDRVFICDNKTIIFE